LPEIGLVTFETPADRLNPGRVDFALRFGPQPGPAQNTPFPFFAAVLSTDEVVLAVNSTNPVISLTSQLIGAIFSGQVTQWNDLDSQKVTPLPTETGLAIQVWSYPPGDDVRQVFDKAFMQGKTPAGQTYLAPDSSAMLEALAQNPGAVGYLLKSQLNSEVRSVRVNGIPSSNLAQPILALSLKEPEGYARQLLLCLQGK
jgi:ABC-type phosphate transport system substrate-binding protein